MNTSAYCASTRFAYANRERDQPYANLSEDTKNRKNEENGVFKVKVSASFGRLRSRDQSQILRHKIRESSYLPTDQHWADVIQSPHCFGDTDEILVCHFSPLSQKY